MNPFSKKNRWQVKVVVSLLFVGWLIFKVQWGQVWIEVQKLQSAYLVAYIALILIGVLVSAKKWSFIARAQGFDLSVRKSFSAYLTGMFLNNFFPSTIGGDTYRSLWLAEDTGRGKAGAFLTVFLDRLTGLVAALVLALAFSLPQLPVLRQSYVWLSTVSLLGFVFAFGIALRFFGARFLMRHRHRFDIAPLKPVATVIRSMFAESFSQRVFIGATGYALLFNFFGVGVSNYILFQALGISISFLSFASAIFLISIISSIPVSINNIGIKEWAYYTFFGLLGVNVSAAIAVALTGRILQMLVSFLALPRASRWVLTRR
jgi:uncharacterized protein (TIRG00374 family)